MSTAFKAQPAEAANGNPVLLGASNSATATTSISTTGGDGLDGITSANGQSGLLGQDDSSGGGVGVSGVSASGIGVSATSSAGTALAVHGKVSFSRSGVAIVAAGMTSVTIALSGVSSSSLVLATLQQVQRGVLLAGVVPGTDSFTIFLSRVAASPLNVAWFVIG